MQATNWEYRYLGDRATDPALKNRSCRAIRRRSDGKCIRGKNGNMLVFIEGIGPVVLIARLLRKINF